MQKVKKLLAKFKLWILVRSIEHGIRTCNRKINHYTSRRFRLERTLQDAL